MSRQPAAKSDPGPVDRNDFKIEGKLAKCKYCPVKPGITAQFDTANLKRHWQSDTHQRERIAALKANKLKLSRTLAAGSHPKTTAPAASASRDERPESSAVFAQETASFEMDFDRDEPPVALKDDTTTDEPKVPVGFFDATGQRIFFSAGSDDFDPLAASLARAIQRASGEESLPDDGEDIDEDDPLYCPDVSASAEELLELWKLSGPHPESEWFPWRDKAMCLTEILFSSPRLRFSRAQQKAILTWGKELGAQGVPSYDSFRKTQDALKQELGDPSRREESGRGNVYYINEIGNSIAKDVANPHTRAGMMLYPEDNGSKLSEATHASKILHDVPDHLLSPNVRQEKTRKIFYVGELATLTHKRWFLPKRWVIVNKVLCGVGHNVSETVDGLVVDTSTTETIPLSTFELNYPDILDANCGMDPLAQVSSSFSAAMPHPLRAVAGDRLVYSMPIIIFIDDVSGNVSKQWNKYFSCYMSNGAIPREKLESEFHVRFVATSPFATPLEIMQGVRSSFERARESPIPSYDCELKEEVLVQPYPLLKAGDNPMQAELCSCAGLACNFFCRTCKVGGTKEHKQSDEGFAEILKEGEMRQPSETLNETFNQILTALEPNVASTLTEAVRLSGVKDALAQPIIDTLVKMGKDLRKAEPEKTAHSPDEVAEILVEELKKHQSLGDGIINPLLSMDGLDIHKDTPTEILHTILLGIVKYYWGQTVQIIEKAKQFPLFQSRLNSLSSDGLNVPKIQVDYMCQYRGGLIGKHFKTISQVMAFAVYDLVPKEVLEAWLIMGRLTVLLWHTEIEDIDVYTASQSLLLFSTFSLTVWIQTELESCIDDFMDITCRCSPSILITKPKFHFLKHIPWFIRRFGPAVLFSTERYEAYNAVFRASAVHSNRQYPSRDVAWSFASMDRVKHIVTGGWWKDSRTKKWTRASKNVMKHILSTPVHAAMVGLPTKRKSIPGTIVHQPLPKSQRGLPLIDPHLDWPATIASQNTPTIPLICTPTAESGAAPIVRYLRAKSVVTKSGDVVLCDHNVIVRQEGGPFSPLAFGTVREILVPTLPTHPRDTYNESALISVQLFELGSVKHSLFDMATLSRTSKHVVLASADLEAHVNLQHDCHRGKCEADKELERRQEGETTKRKKVVIGHTDNTHFIINTQSLHNYRQLAASIPARLRESSFKVEDRAALHASAAENVRNHVKLADTEASTTNGPSDPLAPQQEMEGGDYDDNEASDAEATYPSLVPGRAAPKVPVFMALKGKGKEHAKKVSQSLSDTTKPVLAYFCGKYKLGKGGKKQELLDRLTAHLARNQIDHPAQSAILRVEEDLKEKVSLGKRKRDESDSGGTGSRKARRLNPALEAQRETNSNSIKYLFY